ncbi:MAG: Crp/Fnr family transcriptional regulator [Elusimicrobiota bacterium]
MEQKMSIFELLKRVPLFSGLPENDIRRIEKITRKKHIEKNKLIFDEHSYGNSLYIVISGRVKIFSRLGEKKKTLTYLEPKDCFGELALLGQRVRSAAAKTITFTELLIIDRNSFTKLLRKYPEISMNLLSILCKRLYNADKEIELITFQDVFGRVCKVLLNLSEKYGRKTTTGVIIDIALDHKEIAEFAGTVREMATKTLSKLRKMGCIDYQNQRIIVIDEAKLKDFVRR